MAVVRRSRLCLPHQRQWSNAGTPDREAWALTAAAIYTSVDVVPLTDLAPAVVVQVLRGYEAQLADRDTKGYEVLVGRPADKALRKVQVKTVRTQPWYVHVASFTSDLSDQVTT